MPNWKRKYLECRKQFKQELYEVVKNNAVYVPMIFETYRAYQHQKHIHMVWELMGDFPNFKEMYIDELMGKTLTGREEMLHNLAYSDERFKKYMRKIPNKLAMGDALAIAKRVQREMRE